MDWYECGRCRMMVAEAARGRHDELNHPTRRAGNLAALERAREARRERLIEQKLRATQLSVSWEGAAR